MEEKSQLTVKQWKKAWLGWFWSSTIEKCTLIWYEMVCYVWQCSVVALLKSRHYVHICRICAHGSVALSGRCMLYSKTGISFFTRVEFQPSLLQKYHSWNRLNGLILCVYVCMCMCEGVGGYMRNRCVFDVLVLVEYEIFKHWFKFAWKPFYLHSL